MNIESKYLLFETIKVVDSIPVNLSWHQERVNFAFKKLLNGKAFNLHELIQVPENHSSGISRCRFSYNDKEWTTEFSQYTPRQVKTLKLVDGNGIVYPHKFVDRSALNTLYDLREDCDDILISVNGHITDTSIANILFSDGKNWFTTSTPLLPGTTRARLINQGIIIERVITVNNFRVFSDFMLINAMNDFDLNKKQPVKFLID